MARSTYVVVTDDLDGTEGASTVTFGLDGRQYQVDLSEKNEATLRKALQSYLKVARRVVTSRADEPRAHGPRTDYDPVAVRSWAAAAGVEVSPRGRLSKAIIERYRAAGV